VAYIHSCFDSEVHECWNVIAVSMQKVQQSYDIYCDVAGFLGVDCSVDAALPPVIGGIRTGPVCDIRRPNPCTFVSIFLTQFAFIDTFSCRFVCMTLWLVILMQSSNFQL